MSGPLDFSNIAPEEKSQALDFSSIAPEEKEQKPTRAQIDLTGSKLEGSAIDAAVALLEQPGKALHTAVSGIVTPLKAGMDTLMSRVPGIADRMESEGASPEDVKRYRELSGMSAGQAFMSEYNRIGENMHNAYVPITSSGEKLSSKIGEIFDSAIRYVGDDWFARGVPMAPIPGLYGLRIPGTAESPIVGAAGQTAAAAALMMLGPQKAKDVPGAKPAADVKPPPPKEISPSEAWQQFADRYPDTAGRFDASSVGKIRLQDFKKTDKDVFDAVGRKLDDALSLPEDATAGIPLDGKMRLFFQSLDPTIPVKDLDMAVRSTMDGLRQLDAARVARADQGLPFIQDPAVSKDPVVVTKGGTALTPDQVAAGDAVFADMDLDMRANVMGISAMGRMRLTLEQAQQARVDGDIKAANKLDNQLKREWAQNFAYRDNGRRTAALERFINFGGRMTWDEAVQGMGPQKGVPKGQMPRGVGAKQRGSISLEGFERPEENRPRQRAWTPGTQDTERPMYEKVQAAFNKNRVAEEESIKKTLAAGLARLKRSVVGHDVDLKNALEKSGPYGEKARLRMVLQRSATDAAKTEMDTINDRIFNDLSGEDKARVDELMRARRIIEIQSYKPDYKVPEGITGQEAEGWARQLARDIGQEKFDQINAKTDAIMMEYRRLLADAYSSGILSKESFDKLIHFEYSPTEYIDLLDPIVQYNIKGQKITVRGSGIADLGHGKGDATVRMDSQVMLAEAIARTRNRQFKNNTLQALWDLADIKPDNGIVKIQDKGKPGKHPPSGWTSFDLRIEGEQRQILMNDEFAQQFVSNPQPMVPFVANALRVMSGSSTMRFMAVGGNPAFIVAGIPMDILHTWLASGREYSAHAPMYAAQIAKDMIEVLPDLLKKTGKYQQAMKEGLGAQYMSSYGQHVFTRDKTLAERMMPRHEKILKVMQGMNQEADMWIRLAHRERLIKNGMPSEQATAMARDRLDYSQGGEIIKAIDNVVAFTNVGVQALYKVGKAAERNPADFAIKAGWVAGAVGASVLGNMIASPNTWKQIPTSDKIRGINLSFGDQLYLIDQDGNKRYMYVPIRLDQVAAPISASIVGGLEMAEYGKMPSGLIKETVNQSTNLLGTTDLIPIISALEAMAGWDSFRQKPVYQGPKVKPGDETRPDTHPLSRAVGKATGLSPMRLETAFGKFVSPNNLWIQMAGGGLRLLLGDSDEREKTAMSQQFLIEHLRPIVKLTNPMTQYLDSTEDRVMEEGSHKKIQQDALDSLVAKGNMKDVQAYISTQPKEDRDRLTKHATIGYQVDKIMQRNEAGSAEGVPPRSWWKITGAASARVRAQEFYSKWLDADTDGRRSMERIAQSLQNSGTGYMSGEFQMEMAREKRLLGTDQR